MDTLIIIAAICFIIRTICCVSEKFDIRIKKRPEKKQAPLTQKKSMNFKHCVIGDNGDCSHVVDGRDQDLIVGCAIIDLEDFQVFLFKFEQYESLDGLQPLIDASKALKITRAISEG